MMFTSCELSNAKITDALLKTLVQTKELFLGQDGVYRYAIMPDKFFKFEIVRKTAEKKFSTIISNLDPAFRIVINGNYFKCISGGCYATASFGDIATPEETDSVGDVIQTGSIGLPDKGQGDQFAYFGRLKETTVSDYRYGPGNPPVPPIYEGAGGLGPLILSHPKTGERMRYGDGNLYKKGAAGPVKGDPGAEWPNCIQRNNNTYISMNKEQASGMGALGVSTRGFLVAVIKPHGEKGSLDALRDKLWDIGVDGACFLDGSNSVLMAIDRKMIIHPASFKDNLIEVGFGFRKYS